MEIRLSVSNLFLFMLIFLTEQNLNAQEAVIKESQQILKTYPFYDPNPIADIGSIYPYFQIRRIFPHRGTQ